MERHFTLAEYRAIVAQAAEYRAANPDLVAQPTEKQPHVAKALEEAEQRDLFHTTSDGYDVGQGIDENDIRAILDAAGFTALRRAAQDVVNAWMVGRESIAIIRLVKVLDELSD